MTNQIIDRFRPKYWGFLSLLAIIFYTPWLQPRLQGEEKNYFEIEVIDAQSKRGVPLIDLSTTNDIHYITDSAGRIAFNEPGFMDQEIYLSIQGHGYEYPADGFGFRGVRVKPKIGEKKVIEINRKNLAERLYRLTGQGIYRDTDLLGLKKPFPQKMLIGQIVGQDSVQMVAYQNRLFWVWGDTNQSNYPLGNYSTCAATSYLPGHEKCQSEKGIEFDYITSSEGRSKAMVSRDQIGKEGPIWLSGLTTISDRTRSPRLIASFVRIKNSLDVAEQGLVIYNDRDKQFERWVDWNSTLPDSLPLDGHVVKIEMDKQNYLYSGFGPIEQMRVKADWDDVQKAENYEGFTCLMPGGRFAKEKTILDRDNLGNLIYAWKKNTRPLYGNEIKWLQENGKLKPAERYPWLCDVETGRAITPHGGSLNWNEYRQRWVAIFVEKGGRSSLLGEVWFAEADTPSGPWQYARKIVTHDRYSFYNPVHHVAFDADRGRIIYFQGTYANTFSGNPLKTPRYDYNQIMYRLDLQQQELQLPVAIYQLKGENGKHEYATAAKIRENRWFNRIERVAFYACLTNKPITDKLKTANPWKPLRSLYAKSLEDGSMMFQLSNGKSKEGSKEEKLQESKEGNLPFCYTLADGEQPNAIGLYLYRRGNEFIYATASTLPFGRWTPSEKPVAWVWDFHVPNTTFDWGATPAKE